MDWCGDNKMNKYKIKEPPVEELQTYKEVCIRCGKEQIQTWPKSLPIPNMTEYSGNPSWLQCKLGNHYYYTEDQLEKNH